MLGLVRSGYSRLGQVNPGYARLGHINLFGQVSPG